MICTLNLAGDSPGPQQFRSSLLHYLASDAFAPSVELEADAVRGLFSTM